jgi:predicted Zn-dependent protease
MDTALAQAEEGVSPEDEYYLGRAVAANILEYYSPYWDNPALTDYLNAICGVLVMHSDKPLIFNGYHVMILDSPEINAFATSGGHIFVTRGLINGADSEDALAAVLAHEIAHIQLRHGVKLIENMRLAEDLSAASDRAGRIAGRGSPAEQRTALFISSVQEMVNAMLISGYAQAQEFEADTAALALLAKAGYAPSSLIDVLNALSQRQSLQSGGFNNTHPSPALRITNVERAIGRYRIPDTRSFRLDRFRSFK